MIFEKHAGRDFYIKAKGLTGIILIVLAIGGIFYWENFGRQEFLYKEVVVLNRDAEKNTIITKDMISLEKRDKSFLINDAADDPSEIVGMETKNFIPKGMEISRKFLEEPELVLKENEYIVRIPDDWVYAFPQSLRRKDKIYFYPVKLEKGSQSEANSNAFDSLTVIEDDAEPAAAAVAAYVKDSGNREVTDAAAERMDGTSVIASIEIIADDTKISALRSWYEKGYGFIILYQ